MVTDSDFALGNGLFADRWKSDQFKGSGQPAKLILLNLPKSCVSKHRIEMLLYPILKRQPFMEV